MTTWTRNELTEIGESEELQISSLRRDGTARKPVTVWVVRVEGDLYVRSVNGRSAAWFRGVEVRHEGRVHADSMAKDVTFLDTDPDLNDQIEPRTAPSTAATPQRSSTR
jgi:hypothetical protein